MIFSKEKNKKGYSGVRGSLIKKIFLLVETTSLFLSNCFIFLAGVESLNLN